MFKEIYNPTQKKCNVPQNLGYDTKSLCSEHTYFNHSILRRKLVVKSKFHNTNLFLSKFFREVINAICPIFFVFV